MSKFKAKKFKTKIQNPTGIPCEKDSELYQENYSASDTESIAEKLKSPCAEDREIGAMILANMASNQQFVTNLIENKIIRVAAPLLIDKSLNVRHAIAGSLRKKDETDQKQSKQIWSPISMTKAVEAVKEEKMEFEEAAEIFKVPETILIKLFQEKYCSLEETSQPKIGDQTIINPKVCKGQKVKQEWSVLSMAEAIEAVEYKKINWTHAAKSFAVPKATLKKLVREIFDSPESASQVKMDCPATFKPNAGELKVEKHCVQKSWSSLSMENAITAVRKEKMGWKEAAKIFGVPKATLKRLLYEKHNIPSTPSQSLLTPALKDDLKISESSDQQNIEQTWSPESMEKALKAVNDGKIGWKKAAKAFRVPKATLRRLLSEKYTTPEEAPQRTICSTVLSPYPEEKFKIKELVEQQILEQPMAKESTKKVLETVDTEEIKQIKACTTEVPKLNLSKLFQEKDTVPDGTLQSKMSYPKSLSPDKDLKIRCNNALNEIKPTCSSIYTEKAVEELKVGYKKSTEILKVPKTTSKKICREKCVISELTPQIQISQPTVLSPEIEKELIKYFSSMESMLFDLTLTDVKSIANQLSERNNIERPFRKMNMSDSKWLKKFFKDQKKRLSVCQPSRTSFPRALGFNQENVNQFFNALISICKKNGYSPDRIFNVGEYSFAILQHNMPEVICLRGERQISSLTSAERESLITFIVCMSANGEFVPPLVIFPKCGTDPLLKMAASPGAIFDINSSGWINMNLFTKWFKHFLETTKPTKESPVLLILDGLSSYTHSIDVVDLARNNHVTMISLPMHSADKMRPLDKTFIPQMKTYYCEEVSQWLCSHQGPLNAYDVLSLFEKAYIRCQTNDTAINGFKMTGIYPINRKCFDVEFFSEAQQEDARMYSNAIIKERTSASTSKSLKTSES